MSRFVFITAFLALALQSSQAQLFSHGVPASVTSPEPDGRQHGVPASVVSPTQLPFGVNPPLRQGFHVQGPLRRFGGPGRSHRPLFVPVPVFYSYYTDGGYPSAADPYVPDAPADQAAAPQSPQAQADRGADRGEDELRAAYLQGARDALTQQRDSRYGEHYMDSRERGRPTSPATEKKPRSQDDAAVSKPAAEDKSPATVFIFKDGHQLETRNYAIMGETLFDFSDKTLKKIQLNELDTAATTKANDDRGVAVKLQ